MYEKNEALKNFDHFNCLNYTFAVVKIKHKVVVKEIYKDCKTHSELRRCG